MTVSELTALTATEAAQRIRDGDLSAVDYASALLARAEERSDLNLFISIRPEAVFEAAKAADHHRDSGAELGALHGIPVAVKDSVNTASLPTSNGTASLRGFTAQVGRRHRAKDHGCGRHRVGQDQPHRAVLRLDQQQRYVRSNPEPT